jgi:hypothetical protein
LHFLDFLQNFKAIADEMAEKTEEVYKCVLELNVATINNPGEPSC